MKDAEIIGYVKQGNTRLFSQLVEKYHRSLLGFIFRVVRDPSIVEDIGQDSFFSAFQSLSEFDENRGTPFSSWLFTIARNKSLTEIRTRKRKFQETVPVDDELPDSQLSIEQTVISREEQELVNEAIGQLPEPFKTTLEETLQGKGMNEIAYQQQVSPQTVRSRLSRAREKLRQYFQAIFGRLFHD
jgi:RNA polymerase sigma-70 factor (ECF subfamily)